MDSACERRTRAEPAQPVTTSTRITVASPGGRNAARMTSSGSPGSSRKTLVTRDSASSMHVPKYAERQPDQDADARWPRARRRSPTSRELRAPHSGQGEHVLSLGCGAEPGARPTAAGRRGTVISDGSPGASTGASSARRRRAQDDQPDQGLAVAQQAADEPVTGLAAVGRAGDACRGRVGAADSGVVGVGRSATAAGSVPDMVILLRFSRPARAGRGGRRRCRRGSSPAARPR